MRLYYGWLNVDGAGDNDMAANMLHYEINAVAITIGELFSHVCFFFLTASRQEMQTLNGTKGYLF